MAGIDRATPPRPRGSIPARYTDGLVEERGRDIDLGIDDLRAAPAHARAGSLDELADQLLRKARHSPHRPDDVALLLTGYFPTRAPQIG